MCGETSFLHKWRWENAHTHTQKGARYDWWFSW
jgi:hypothetical protein